MQGGAINFFSKGFTLANPKALSMYNNTAGILDVPISSYSTKVEIIFTDKNNTQIYKIDTDIEVKLDIDPLSARDMNDLVKVS